MIDIKNLYQEYVLRGGGRSLFIEGVLAESQLSAPSVDELLRELFIGKFINNIFREMCELASKNDFNENVDVINGLMFVQDIGAQALWKFHINIGEKFEHFVRSFDRLDVESERGRLDMEIKTNKSAYL